MKTILDKSTIQELITRIESLKPEDKAQWGIMTPYQMVKHCILSEEMYQGTTSYSRLFIGRLFGKMALNGTLKNEDFMKKNQPTHPTFKITGTGDFFMERTRWIELIKKYSSFSNNNFTHPFFGKMNPEQIGKYVYKHTDHHLRQFNR